MSKTRKTIAIERTYRAPLDDVWELWTTKEGIESWWGPDGFNVTVDRLELRPGGRLDYVMHANAPEQIAFMKRSGMPLSTPGHITYVEVTPMTRLAYRHAVDFVPNVAPYDVLTVVELSTSPAGVKLQLTIDAMHDETWTQRAVMGWKNELEKLAAALAS